MADQPTAKLYSTEEGKIVSWNLEVDKNNEIVATHKDEMLKFPGDVTKKKLLSLFDQHNKAHEGIKARSAEDVQAEEDARNQAQELLSSL